MRACILIRTGRGSADAVSMALRAMPGVRLAFPVFGSVDVIVRAEVKDLKDLRRLSDAASVLPGVVRTETLPELLHGGL